MNANTNDLVTMISKAQLAMKRAYAPYSHFSVGACIKTGSDKLFSGCNVENASYGLTLCAEASAIATMVSSGETKIKEIVVMANSTALCVPCGACLQRIQEFANAATLVHLCHSEGLRKTIPLRELLPYPFGAEQLQE